MTKREELIEEIEGELPSLPVDGEWVTQASFEQIADFILAREAKILDEIEKPLRWQVEMEGNPQIAVDEALSTINRLRKEADEVGK